MSMLVGSPMIEHFGIMFCCFILSVINLMPSSLVSSSPVIARMIGLLLPFKTFRFASMQAKKLNMKINNTSLSCNIINGGEKVNIVSRFAKLVFDIRSPYANFAEKAISKIKQFISRLQTKYKGCKISITKTLEIPALEKRKSKTIDKTICQFALKEKEFRGGCEAGYLQQVGGDAFVFGVGDLNLAHKPNEFVEIDQLKTYNQKLMQMIDFLCKQ